MKIKRVLIVEFVYLGALICGGLSKVQADPRIKVYPERIHLSSATDPQRVLVIATGDDGLTQNLADEARFEISPAHQQLIAFEDGCVIARTSGEAVLGVVIGEQRFEIPVTVAGVDNQQQAVGFHREVMPVLTRAGCNTGTCHGSARGQDKFRLSLFGYDPAGDYYRITREQTVRRINLALPDDSLLLTKATAAVPHTGGQRFEPDSDYYATIRRWIEEGALNQDAESAQVDRIELFPPEAVLAGAGAQQPLLVMAYYSDGRERDVTSLAVFISRDDQVAAVDQRGVLRAQSRGESFITARFEKHTVGMNSIVLPPDDHFQPQAVEGNYIDELIAEKLNKLHLHPVPVCSDEEFLRRIYLDLCGLLPEESEYERFLADTSPDKRQVLIDELLNGEEFIDLWTTLWADLLLVRPTNVLSDKASARYSEWLRDSIRQGVPLDEIVYELLTVSGTTFEQPATGFYAAERNRLKIAENVAQVFLGIRLQCAKCHNHPFDRWTMDDYYGFAAFFAHVGRKQNEDYRDTIIYSGGGRTKHPVTGQNVMPKFLGGGQPDVKGKDRRRVVADWITQENPYFAATAANRLWGHFFGRGVVQPVDDVRISNPPVNVELYETLSDRLVEYDFDFRRLARDIVSSHAYQRSADNHGMTSDEARVVAANFGKATYRRISATILLDCICQVTESPSQFAGVPIGSRAAQLADQGGNNYFLKTFGRSPRTSVCACESTEPTLSQALHLLNGATIHNKIKQGKVIQRMLEEGASHEDVLRALYLRCLSRAPTEQEVSELLTSIKSQKSTPQALEDVFWAMLNSREFVFNH